MSDIPPRALRDALRDRLSSQSSAGCADADMLAAWCDGTMTKSGRATLESHAAECARCQALLAAMAKTAAPLPSRKWWHASTVRWLVPIGAISVLAVAVWISTPAPRLTAPATRSEVPAASASTPIQAQRRADTASPSAKASASLAAQARERGTPMQGSSSLPGAAAAAPTELNAPPSAARDATAPISVDAQAPPERPQAAPAAQAPAEARSEAFRTRVAAADNLAALRVQRSADSSAPLDIPSPDPNVRWRVVAGGIVQRSTNGGAAWQTQSTGATQWLTAGAAPTPTVCWLVGGAGAVLVSRDGQTWQRVSLPEATDLTGIAAIDGLNATATAADGRAFSTTDGGVTWHSR